MSTRSLVWTSIALAGLAVSACKTTQSAAPSSAGEVSAGTPAPASSPGTGNTTGTGGSSIPALVSVNLQNVLNDLSISLQVNRNNIPVTAQVPIAVAASVCGVSVDVLAASAANGHASCTATTSSPQLSQAVQQQIASGGSVTGGPQTMGGTTPTNQM
ncbi:hypothetical protein [Sphingomonas limnosediminicola]|uniref:hypothetical protein n=1 Tax=Sphingomonas limnosediminicola TaxID=940133 RepID=UPI0031CE311D